MHKSVFSLVLIGTSLLLVMGCSVPKSGIPSAPTTLKNAAPDAPGTPGRGAHRVDVGRVDKGRVDEGRAEEGRFGEGRDDEARDDPPVASQDEPVGTQVPPPGPTTFAVQTVVIVVSTAPGTEPGSPSKTGPATTITVTPTPVPSETSPTNSADPRTTEPPRAPDPVVTSTSSTPPTSLSEDAGSTAAGV